MDAKSVATSKHHASWHIPAISRFLLQSKSYCLSQNHKLTTPSRKAKGGESQPRNFQTHKDQARSMPHAMWMAPFPLSQAQPHWGSFRKPWTPALVLNSETTRAETVYFISIYLPWWPALEKVPKNTKKPNIVVRQQIQEKIWEITWRLCDSLLGYFYKCILHITGYLLDGYSTKFLTSFRFLGKLIKISR